MIDKWTILHLERRHDRAPLAFSNAERLGVPREKVRFWYAKDNEDFQDTDSIIEAIVADGFPVFRKLAGHPRPPGTLCQTWNVCRYLRDLASRDAIEMFIHDGMMFRDFHSFPMLFYPDFQWLCDIITECCKQPVPFKMLAIGDLMVGYDIEPITPGSIISRGLGCIANSIRIYSSHGAKHVLERIRSQIETRTNYHADSVLHEFNGLGISGAWSLPGMYTLLTQRCAYDMPSAYLGSDSQDWESYCGVYKQLFEGFSDHDG